MVAIHLPRAAEIWNDGPTGEFVEVLAGKLVDAGGNVIAEGSAGHCVWHQRRLLDSFKKASRLIPTEWREVVGEVVGADHTWSMVAK